MDEAPHGNRDRHFLPYYNLIILPPLTGGVLPGGTDSVWVRHPSKRSFGRSGLTWSWPWQSVSPTRRFSALISIPSSGRFTLTSSIADIWGGRGPGPNPEGRRARGLEGLRSYPARAQPAPRVPPEAARPMPALKLPPHYSRGRKAPRLEHFFVDLARHWAYLNIGVLRSRLVGVRVTAP